MPETYFQVRRPKIVYEAYVTEVVIVNLDSGAYYSLEGTAQWIWQAVLDGFNQEQIVEKGLAEFDVEASELRAAVTDLLAQLQAEGIIVAAAAPPVAGAPAAHADGQHGSKPAFTIPVLSRYTDMQDLLLLDPIHDMDASGWPKPAGN
jgi:hypothetical protein